MGVLAVGNFSVGGALADAPVRGLGVVREPGGGLVKWSRPGVVDPGEHRLLVGVDGELVAILPGGELSFNLGPVGPGEHRVDVVAQRSTARRPWELYGVDGGRRVYLRWPASVAADCRGYVVTGTRGADVVEALVDVIDVEASWEVEGSAGVGRVSISGSWLGGARNGVFSLETDGAGLFRHDVGGDWSPWERIVRGGRLPLALGVFVTFEDALSDYAAATYEVFVGVRRDWLSGVLGAGTWSFEVAAVDAAGNVGDALTALSVVVAPRPEPVAGLVGSVLGGVVRLSWQLPSEDLEVRLYSNFSNTFGTLGELILEDGPWVSLGAGVEEYEFTPLVDGPWRFWVRTFDPVTGREGSSVEGIELEVGGLDSGVLLNEPEQVVVLPTAGGRLLVRWAYRQEGGVDLTGFAVYANEDPGDLSFGSALATPVGVVIGTAGVREFEVEVGPFTHGVTQWVTVRARAGSVETLNVDVVAGVPDDEAPELAGILQGVAN